MKVDMISLKFCINLKSQEMDCQNLISVLKNVKFSTNSVFRLRKLALNNFIWQITIFNFNNKDILYIYNMHQTYIMLT